MPKRVLPAPALPQTSVGRPPGQTALGDLIEAADAGRALLQRLAARFRKAHGSLSFTVAPDPATAGDLPVGLVSAAFSGAHVL